MGVLRFLLAVIVVLSHLNVMVGWWPIFAVKMFFIISGYYMAMILERDYHDKITFWINRALKLYPAYFIVLILSVTTALSVPNYYLSNFIHLENWPSLGGWYKALFAFSNITFFGLNLSLFTCLEGKTLSLVTDCKGISVANYVVNLPAWTLAVEVMFYLVAPWLVRIRGLLWFIAAGIAAQLILMAEYGNPWHRSLFIFELVYFLMGIQIYRWLPNLATDKDRALGDLSYPIYIGHIYVLSVLQYLEVIDPWVNLVASLAFAYLLAKAVQPIESIRKVLREGKPSVVQDHRVLNSFLTGSH